MPIVGMPDGTQVQFPDEMPPQAIKTLISTKFPDATKQFAASQTSPAQNMLIAQQNLLPAATQGTSPNPSDYKNNLISDKAFESDSGEVLYRDPATGQVRPTDNKTQVAIRDPADNTVKIYNRSQSTNENPAVGISRVLAPGLGAGAPMKTAGGIVTSEALKPGMVNSSDVLKTATPFYEKFNSIAGAVPIAEDSGQKIVDRIRGAVKSAGQSPTNAEPVFNAISDWANGGDLNAASLRDLKEQLGKDFAKSPEPRLRAASGTASSEIRKIIGEIVPEEAATALNTADAITAPGKTLQTVNQLENVAQTKSQQNIFGQSANEKLRGFFANIITKMQKTRPPDFQGSFMGFKPDEISAIKDMVEGSGALQKGARIAASFAPEKGILRTMFEVTPAVTAATVGHAATGGASLAGIAGIGVAGDVLSRILDARKLGVLKDTIAKRSPLYAQAVQNAVSRLQQSQNALSMEPSPAKLGAFVASARQLSSGLTRDGIKISSGEIMKLLQSPAKSAAESNQEEIPGNPSQ